MPTHWIKAVAAISAIIHFLSVMECWAEGSEFRSDLIHSYLTKNDRHRRKSISFPDTNYLAGVTLRSNNPVEKRERTEIVTTRYLRSTCRTIIRSRYTNPAFATATLSRRPPPSRRRGQRAGDPHLVISRKVRLRTTYVFDRNGDNDVEENKNKLESDERIGAGEDLPAWVKALIQWKPSGMVPRPDASLPIGSENVDSGSFLPSITGGFPRSQLLEEEMSPLVASLSGMVNAETLSAESEVDNAMKPIPILPILEYLKEGNKAENLTTDKNPLLDENATVVIRSSSEAVNSNSESKPFTFLDSTLRWDNFVSILQKNVQEAASLGSVYQRSELNNTDDKVVGESLPAAEKILRDATQRLEDLINGTSSAFSPTAIQELILRASQTLALQDSKPTAAAFSVFKTAGNAPWATTAQYTAELVAFASRVLTGGFVTDVTSTRVLNDGLAFDVGSSTPKGLFDDFPTVTKVPMQDRRQTITKAAEFASLSGAIYENAIFNTHNLGHSIVAQGKTAGIAWIVTDSLQFENDFRSSENDEEESNHGPLLVRSIIIRGYDAGDDEVDREGLLDSICTASPVSIGNKEGAHVKVHEGLLTIARELMSELEKFIDLTSMEHKLVFTGHSIGGALSVLILMILAETRGSKFVEERILRVFTFGSPPIAMLDTLSDNKSSSHEVPTSGDSFMEKEANTLSQLDQTCSILDAFGLSTSIVYGFNQPWDPIVRLFTEDDPLYPLIDDLGDDGVTLYASGPNRALRPITKAILESWGGWPGFRDNARPKLGQNYKSVGRQHLLLPEPSRYLTDRLVSVNTAVPPVDEILRISSDELLPALKIVFPLDTFTISYVPVAIRSFIHHFYPAYDSPFVNFAAKLEEARLSGQSKRQK